MSDRTITLYSKPRGCVQCIASHRKLEDLGLEFVEFEASESLDKIAELDPAYTQAPVMSVAIDGVIVDHWTGYRPDKLEALALAAAA